MEKLANEIYETLSDMDYMDYIDTKEEELQQLLQDLQLLEKQGNVTLLNAIKMLVEELEWLYATIWKHTTTDGI